MSDDKDPQAADILVPSKDPVKKDEDKPKANGDVKGKGKEEAEENDIVSPALAAIRSKSGEADVP